MDWGGGKVLKIEVDSPGLPSQITASKMKQNRKQLNIASTQFSSESPFFAEWLASGRMPNQLAISGACNCDCLFCSNNTNPFPILTNVLRDIDDIKHQLSLMPPHDRPIRLSDSLPGRISEGEALLHPRLWEILELVRRKYPFSRLCFTTNGSMLDEQFMHALARFNPLEVNLSIHSTDPSLWSEVFGRSPKAANTAIHALDLFREHRIQLVGTIVPLPAICGWNDIASTYRRVALAGAKRVILYQPGFTTSTPPSSVRLLDCPTGELHEFADRIGTETGVPAQVLPELRGELKVAVAKIVKLTGNSNPLSGWNSHRHPLWLASEAAADRLRETVASESAKTTAVHRVETVVNRTYGGNIVVSGLLMVSDFVESGRAAIARWPETDLVLIPGEPFDALNRDLRRQPAHLIAESVGRPVWVVRDGERPDPLIGRIFARVE